ncbi:RNA polymerase ECF family sigma subunit [Herbihabitans rhizosphaerae]|uniref:RNA polymerase ECF family sigma subunit n=1 Tax=Herbihabitans rhizosphaerae TaxID=1872711 RepID=A0A4Q7KEX9_9PSEU|nr:sigma-70 family RNA polymerase sigma factor [Herbihabitans rhizosphaerae]RZS32824.1 RNA polymerase ECF family sigma subunit [Herbihabitans rhizosphaerae]
MSTVDSAAAVGAELERYRVELTGYCYRMLGSAFDADDAVQDTLVRAWRRFDSYDPGRAPLRSWLHSIATSVCLDMLRGRQRRARAMDLAAPSTAGAPMGPPQPESLFLQPIPDERAISPDGDPAEVVAQRETIRTAFVAALQLLPPKQRAVLILRDVLAWKADEVAGLLDTTVASVNSALQRARATLGDGGRQTDPFDPSDDEQRNLLDRYCAAFERHDVDTLVALLHEDATMTMPPFLWWLRGRAEQERALRAPDLPCASARLLPTAANGSPAFGQYMPDEGGVLRPFAIVVLGIADGLILDSTTYLDGARLFPLFGLPDEFPAARS